MVPTVLPLPDLIIEQQAVLWYLTGYKAKKAGQGHLVALLLLSLCTKTKVKSLDGIAEAIGLLIRLASTRDIKFIYIYIYA